MKSFVAYPLEFENLLFPPKSENKGSGKLIAHYELFKKISHLDGAMVQCGITAEEGFRRFAIIKEMLGRNIPQKMVAFEKFQPLFVEVVDKDGEINLNIKERSSVTIDCVSANLINSGITENVEFVPGPVCEAITQYLIDNPELKIALLIIDLDEYDQTLTTLEFFYPRIMPGGILIIDNFYKSHAEQKAVKDYFTSSNATINSFSVNNGPHYIVKP